MFFQLFRAAGATGQVFLLKNGTVVNRGLAYSGLVLATTTVAVVPTTPRVLDFTVEARSSDKQGMQVTGNLKITLSPDVAVSKFDFTVRQKDGSYQSPWEQALHAMVVEHVLAPIHATARTLDIETATQSHSTFAEAVKASVTSEGNPLKAMGINIESCSVVVVEASDDEVAETIGSKERQALIATSDAAIHGRRLKAVDNDRAIKQFEAGTKLALEKKQGLLLDEQAKNKEKEATADARATEIRLAPLNDVATGKILGAAIMEAAKSGRLGSLAITSEFLAAASQK